MKYTLYKSVVYISPLRHNLKFRGPEMLGLLWNIFEIKLILFKFPIKITAFTENLVYDFNYNLPIEINVSNISNYENYFDTNVVSKIDIYNLISKFKNYYNQKKIEMLYIHLDKDYEIDDIIKVFRDYYDRKKVDDIIKEFKDYDWQFCKGLAHG